METRQSAFSVAKGPASDSVDQDIFDATRRLLVEDLGRRENRAIISAEDELRRKIPSAVLNYLSGLGIPLAGATVLDIGAGLGGLSEELVIRGAKVIALEPGAAWSELARRRVERHGGQFRLIQGAGESIPLPDVSVDLIVSLQVLEHVKEPSRVLAEAWRILKPGGYFYLACENYLAFWEGHYDVPWLPLLPKSIGRIYLRWLGRSPIFLDEAVTYTTYPGVLMMCRRLGFVRRRDEEIANALRSKPGAKWSLLRLLARLTNGRGPIMLERASRTFHFGIYELFRK